MTLATAAKFGAKSVFGIDIDHGLVEEAKENAKMNHPKLKAHFMCQSYVESETPLEPRYVILCFLVKLPPILIPTPTLTLGMT